MIDNCLTSMGISTNGTANATSNSSTPVPQQDNATASFCSSPCLGEMMLMTSCFDGIMSSFGFYRPGLMQGVQAVFQMACSGGGGNGSSNATLSRVAYGGESPIPMSKFGVQRCDLGAADEDRTMSTKQFDEQIHLLALELVRFTWRSDVCSSS